MFSVTIEGETLGDIIIRARGLYEALTGRPAPIVGQPANEVSSAAEDDPPVEKPKRGRKGKAEEGLAAEPEFDRVSAASVKEQALDKIRAVYALGPEGMATVNKLAKAYGVKKLGDVPLEKAEELLVEVTKVEKALAKASPI